jgi:hypothetical protein
LPFGIGCWTRGFLNSSPICPCRTERLGGNKPTPSATSSAAATSPPASSASTVPSAAANAVAGASCSRPSKERLAPCFPTQPRGFFLKTEHWKLAIYSPYRSNPHSSPTASSVLRNLPPISNLQFQIPLPKSSSSQHLPSNPPAPCAPKKTQNAKTQNARHKTRIRDFIGGL